MVMVLNHSVYPLINISLSWNVFFSLEEKLENDISAIWKWIFTSVKNIILKGHPILYPLKKRIYETIILDLSCQVIWCLITSWWIWSITRHCNTTCKELVIILQILTKQNWYVQGVTSRLLLEEMQTLNSWWCMSTF